MRPKLIVILVSMRTLSVLILINSDIDSSSSSKSSDDESGNDATTTEPLVDLHIESGGETSASSTQGTLHPAVSSGDLH